MKRCFVIVIVIATALPLVAQEADGPPPLADAAHNQVVRFLQLSDEQAASWDVIYRIHREAERPLQDEAAALQAEIDTLFAAGDPDPAVLGELVIERHAVGEALRQVHLVYHEDFVALLDEAQARRLGFVARADEVQPVIPAFKLYELVPRR